MSGAPIVGPSPNRMIAGWSAVPGGESGDPDVIGLPRVPLTDDFGRLIVLIDGASPSGAGVMFEPGRTLFVAVSWAAGSDPLRFFTDPSLALTAAAALAPTPASPVQIIVYPGTYAQNLNLVSNVHLFGHSQKSVIFSGTVTWTPGSGINAPQAAQDEWQYSSRMTWTGTVLMDSGSKGGTDLAVMDLSNLDVQADLTATGRGAGNDFFQLRDGEHFGTTWLIDSVSPYFRPGNEISAAITFNDCTTGGLLRGSTFFNTVNLVDCPGFYGDQCTYLGAVNVDTDSSIVAPNSAFLGVLTVDGNGTADIRGSEYTTLANLAGTGKIDRTNWSTTVAATAAGVNVIPIAPKYMDTNYNVVVTQKSGVATFVLVQNKQVDQFDLVDSVGGNDFELAIVKY